MCTVKAIEYLRGLGQPPLLLFLSVSSFTICYGRPMISHSNLTDTIAQSENQFGSTKKSLVALGEILFIYICEKAHTKKINGDYTN